MPLSDTTSEQVKDFKSNTVSKPALKKMPVGVTASRLSRNEEDIEALIDVDQRTVVFDQLNSESMVEESNETNQSHPLHKITWYQETNLEDIESAIDEVVEIMEEMNKRIKSPQKLR
jgi:hypothetical protein